MVEELADAVMFSIASAAKLTRSGLASPSNSRILTSARLAGEIERAVGVDAAADARYAVATS